MEGGMFTSIVASWGSLLALTPHITGSKNQSEERAALFAVRVHVIVRDFHSLFRNCPLYALDHFAYTWNRFFNF